MTKTFEQYVDEKMNELGLVLGQKPTDGYILPKTWLKWGQEYGELREMWATKNNY